MHHPRGLTAIKTPAHWEMATTLEAVAAHNLRSLVMPSVLPLRRLMLLVGKNGIGKSTFARFFPLLRQSMGTRTREPLLWWDRDGVDLGSFEDAVRRGEQRIMLSFKFSSVPISSKSEVESWDFSITAELEGDSQQCRVSARTVELGPKDRLRVETTAGEHGPSRALLTKDGITAELDDFSWGAPTAAPSSLFMVPLGRQYEALDQLLKYVFHGNTSDERRFEIYRWLPDTSDEAILAYLRQQPLGAKYKANLADLAKDRTRLKRIALAKRALTGLTLGAMAEDLLTQFTLDTGYLGPFRAIPERLYRSQSVAIETLDPRGSNLVMFLLALTPTELSDLNTMLSEHLDFRVRLRPDGSQHKVEIQLGEDWYNLVDVGFGYSQLLPVAVQIWAAGRVLTFHRRQSPLRCLVVEQPELHLHPHHQALIARALVASAATNEGPVQIIETHSAALIEEVGMLIARGKIERERVGVCCFEVDATGGTQVREANFDEDGVLHGWPVGFLSP